MGMRDDERGYYEVEARWEQTRESPAAAVFFKVDQIGGSLADAKAAAARYLHQHVAKSAGLSLDWIAGTQRKGREAIYASTPYITFRISR